MTTTEALIQNLADDCPACHRLACPATRTGQGLALSIPYVALIMWFDLAGGDVTISMPDAGFLIEQAAALATAVTAALAAFAATVPASNRKLALLPVLPLTIWLLSAGLGWMQEGLSEGLGALESRPDWLCVWSILTLSAGPAIAMAIMLRRGAPLAPHLTTALGGLAAAGLASFAVRFIQEEPTVFVLVWHIGTVVVLTVLAGTLGRTLLTWRSLLAGARSKTASGRDGAIA